jgi:hypothetical protein
MKRRNLLPIMRRSNNNLLYRMCHIMNLQASNALRPFSIKISKVGLRMLPLSRSNPLLPEFPPFMLDVLELVDSSAESPNCVRTQNKQRPEAPARSCRNWTIWLGKLEGPVLWGRWLSGALPSFDEELLLQPSDVCLVERREP